MRGDMGFIRNFVVMLLISFAGATDMQRIAIGVWGGEHIRLEVTAKSATVEYDCAHGTIEGPLTIDGSGRFSLRGTYTLERGGPVRADEQPRSQPATYVGSISGNTMKLTVKVVDEDDETFTLEKGKQGELFKCK